MTDAVLDVVCNEIPFVLPVLGGETVVFWLLGALLAVSDISTPDVCMVL